MLKLRYLRFLFCRLRKEATEEVTLKKKRAVNSQMSPRHGPQGQTDYLIDYPPVPAASQPRCSAESTQTLRIRTEFHGDKAFCGQPVTL